VRNTVIWAFLFERPFVSLVDIKMHVLKFDDLHMTQCAKIIDKFVANVGNVFIERLQTFFYKFFERINAVFFNFYLHVYYIYAVGPSSRNCLLSDNSVVRFVSGHPVWSGRICRLHLGVMFFIVASDIVSISMTSGL